MTRQNKYQYLYVVQGHYGHGWEDLTASESLKEIKADARAYRQNDTAPIRTIKRRVLNEVK